jgi:dipeptidyl aminopeptidase/acylaminoacyl peptidase
MTLRTRSLPRPFARALAVAALALSIPAMPLAAAAIETRTVGSATLQNVPPIPAEVSQAVQRFQNSRAALFEGWFPDGSMLIATRFGDTQQLHHVAAPGAARTQLTFGSEPIASAHVIPGSQRFVLVRDTGGDEWFQLYAQGLTGQPTRISTPGTRNGSPVFSADGRLIVWAEARKGSPAYTILATDPENPSAPRRLAEFPGGAQPADIADTGQTLAVLRSLSNRESQIHLVDLPSGAIRQLTPASPAARYDDARFLPGGRALIAISDRESDTRRLVEIDVETGRETILTPDQRWDIEAFDISPDGRLLAYAVNADGYSRVRVIDRITRRALPQAPLPDGVLTGLAFSPDGRQLAVGLTGATFAGDVWSWSIADAQVTRWTSSELGGLDPARLAVPELIHFRSFDGRRIPAFVYRPTGLPPGTRTPVIIDIHGGPEAQTRPVWNYGAQYFADTLKATVILPNVRGSDGYGKAYLNLDNAEKREDSVKDIGALLDWIATQPGLDPRRVAVYGQSYGGYMSLASMTHYSSRLVGGVERYGISNFITFLERTEAYRRDNRRAEYGDERKPEMRAVFERIAPANNVGRITRPMLVMQGANDPRVPQFESDQIVEKLRAQGNEVWYVLFADEGHGFLKKPNNDLRREVETVFLQKLFNPSN